MRAAWWTVGLAACAWVGCQEDDERPGRSGDRGVATDGAVDGGGVGDRGVDGDGAIDFGRRADRGVAPDGTPPGDGGGAPDAGDAEAPELDAGDGGEPLIDVGVEIDEGPPQPDFECPDCGPDEMCFQFYDGTCGGGQPRCVPRVDGCAPRTCTVECQQALCSDEDVPFGSCDPGLGCGGEAEGAFVCYGP